MGFFEWLKAFFQSIFKPKPDDVIPIRKPDPVLPEAPKPSTPTPAAKLLWYPKAKKMDKTMKSQGTYKWGYPRGAVVHFSAGPDADGLIEYANEMGFGFMVIDHDGTVYQGQPLDSHGAHAGKSNWNHPDVGESVSSKLVGIEVVCAGKVRPLGNGYFRPWWNDETKNPKRDIPSKDVRIIEDETDNQEPGAYHKYTEAQEKALVELLVWLEKNNPDVFLCDLILGHDEVAGPKGIGYWRKNDPGGSLSMTMSKLREKVKASV